MQKELRIPMYVNNIRPLIFLCGPYFDLTNRNDRRNLIKSYISEFKKKDEFEPFALIIDYLFKENDRNLPLLEEIIAECSCKIYILLDTMSASLELGLFSSAYKENSITVFLPKDYQFFKPSIGMFVLHSIEKSKSIKLVQYPNIRYNTFKVISHERIVYENLIAFKKNRLPNIIKENIKCDMNNLMDNCLVIDFDIKKNDRKKIWVTYSENNIDFKIPADILLYLIYNSNNVDSIKLLVLKLYLNYDVPNYNNYRVYMKVKKEDIDVNLSTHFNYSFEVVYKEILAMLHAIAQDGRGSAYRYLKYDPLLYKFKRRKITIYNVLGIDEESNKLIQSYIKNPMKYLDKKKIIIKGKKRTILSYKSNSFGKQMRVFHENLALILMDLFKFSENVFGYIKGRSIQKCVNKHKDDLYFIKLDIKDFFNSMSKTKLNTLFRILITTESFEEAQQVFINKKQIRKKYLDDITGYQKILSAFCYKNKVPLGLTSSPVISNIYLSLFDYMLENELKDLHYSRYADDILISSKNFFHPKLISGLVSENLDLFDLKLNNKKTHYYQLEKSGDYIKFLGINIVKDMYNNKLTIGHKYIIETAKMLSKYLNKENIAKEKVLGRIEFIKFSSNESYEKLCKLIRIKMNLEFDINKFKKDDYLDYYWYKLRNGLIETKRLIKG